MVWWRGSRPFGAEWGSALPSASDGFTAFGTHFGMNTVAAGHWIKTVSLQYQAGLRSVRVSLNTDFWIFSRVIFGCFSGRDPTGRRLGGHTHPAVCCPHPRGSDCFKKQFHTISTFFANFACVMSFSSEYLEKKKF